MANSDAGSAQLLRFDDRTMMYEGDAKDWKPTAEFKLSGGKMTGSINIERGRT